jgi:hypothetical protein
MRILWAIIAVLTGDVRWRRGFYARVVEAEAGR